MELIPFDINADFEKWDIVHRYDTSNRVAQEYHMFSSGIAIIWKGNEKPSFYSISPNVNDIRDLFLTPKVKGTCSNVYIHFGNIGTVEVSIHDNKLIDAKIVEG